MLRATAQRDFCRRLSADGLEVSSPIRSNRQHALAYEMFTESTIETGPWAKIWKKYGIQNSLLEIDFLI